MTTGPSLPARAMLSLAAAPEYIALVGRKRRVIRGWTMLVGALALVGCAIPNAGSVRPGETPPQVRAKLGAPYVERKIASGDIAWYYISDSYTWRVVFGRDGAVSEYAQVMTLENFMRLRQVGANRDGMYDLVGPPLQRMAFARTGSEAWTYRWRDMTIPSVTDAVFDARTGELRYMGIYWDPAYISGGNSGPR